jgi:hypothetical protein
MATMKTTAKTNPITGDPTYPGSTGSKREQRKNAAGKLTRRQNKALSQGVEKQGRGLKQYYKGIPVEETTSEKKPKDWRERSRVGAAIHGTPYAGKKDTGGKKNMTTTNPNKKGKGGFSIVPKSCRGPKEWTR